MLTAAMRGIGWLLDLQNGDGGWPTFCRGWGKLPFDRSGADLTAHALRAIQVWRKPISQALTDAHEQKLLDTRIDRAVEWGLAYLIQEQRPDGSWLPLWFGNQHQADEGNPIYGTARVLLAFRDLGRLDTVVARKGLDWLSKAQNKDGGWGGHCQGSGAKTKCFSSIEESALALETLVSCGRAAVHERAASQGLIWLTNAVEANRHHECSPIGFYFAKLWYYEKLYPLIFTVAALGQAVRLEAARRPGLRGVSTDTAALNDIPLNGISLNAVPLPATKAAVEVRVAK
jgi:squalene-hopene/tetraprenyl-beta-curcumene cyclase